MNPPASDISTLEMLEKLDSIQNSVDSIMTGLNAPKDIRAAGTSGR